MYILNTNCTCHCTVEHVFASYFKWCCNLFIYLLQYKNTRNTVKTETTGLQTISDKYSTHSKQQLIAHSNKTKQNRFHKFNLSTTSGMVNFLSRMVVSLHSLGFRPCLACLQVGSIALWRSDFWMLLPKPRSRSPRLLTCLTSEHSSSCSRVSAKDPYSVPNIIQQALFWMSPNWSDCCLVSGLCHKGWHILVRATHTSGKPKPNPPQRP